MNLTIDQLEMMLSFINSNPHCVDCYNEFLVQYCYEENIVKNCKEAEELIKTEKFFEEHPEVDELFFEEFEEQIIEHFESNI